ncbi:MAG: discoidin domain-containing protein [Candidatus Hydrogenedentes bacterium]|nr:discoidin domain-containing protein [Candidatus Hydrogenedentota bacterium]
MIRAVSCAMGILCVSSAWAQDSASVLSLAGEWRFQLDPESKGIVGKWQDAALPGAVRLPGSLNEQGIGRATTEARVDILSPLYEYVGAAWYQRDIEIPEAWASKRITLFLERCHWESQAWVDGKRAGMQDSLCAPHEYDLSNLFTPGTHRITLRIDNGVKYEVGLRAHSITEHTQTNWNGVIGRIELRATDPVWVASVKTYPDISGKSVRIHVAVNNATGTAVTGRVTAGVTERQVTAEVAIRPGGTKEIEMTLPLGADAPLWDEFSPEFFEMRVTLDAAAGDATYHDAATATFGLREISRKGAQLLFNGRPAFLRGNLECCIFPMTGYPAMDTEAWARMFRIAREYGLNHVRFHSWCPPEAAFIAADEAGISLHVETPIWSDLGKNPATDAFIHREGDRILDTYGNHPSFCMLAVGNEPSGPKKDEFLATIVACWQEKDPRRLYTTCAGWPELSGSDYHVVHQRGRLPYRLHGGPLAPTTAFDYTECLAGADAPVVAHELGQWCVYPNYAEIPKYTGALRGRNLETFRASLDAHRMLDQADPFSKASGALQTLLCKADIEAVLRTPGAGGFQLLSLQDFPGQGSALVGFLDAFWDNKGYVTPEAFREFCSECVPLLRLDKYVWTTDEIFHASAEIANFGRAPITDITPQWRIHYADGRDFIAGALPTRAIPIGNGIPLGEFGCSLADVEAPAKLTIVVSLPGTPHKNHWNLWVYPVPRPALDTSGVLVARVFDEEVRRALMDGGTVLLYPEQLPPRTAVKSAFEPIFWNTQWFPGQRRQLGVLCDPAHPAFAFFPNDGHTDWQWWGLLNGSTVMNLDSLPAAFRPLVQVIDDWNTNRKLGAVFEAGVDAGKLLVCSLGSPGTAPDAAAAWFHESLMRYARSDAFRPANTLAMETVKVLFEPPEFAVVKVDSEISGYEGINAADGDPKSIWHTPWQRGFPKYPHEIQIKFAKPRVIGGLRLLPRQDVANGFIREYELYVGNDGETWGRPAAAGTLENGPESKEIRLHTPVEGQYLRFVALSGHGNDCFAAIAELQPVFAE